MYERPLETSGGAICLLVEILHQLGVLDGKVTKLSAILEPKISDLQAQVTVLVTASAKIASEVSRAQVMIQALIDAGGVNGVTDVQLQALSDISTSIGNQASSISSNADELKTALDVIPPPPTP